ncbi:BglG family transcription antiterminator [Fusibacter ferrireducens]|uniref:BglG family transcription antiterminator n=1 Tax=Fusibacter ferrireducens TaxID=2785058 RepID=A0ABR9ZU67_9FIRM|nr:BglG family transcription antiterminator [Fusibacter ferrireducens]MBF4693992.1 BglG family transcription antiterminator [Fusibacter ferrireducens]
MNARAIKLLKLLMENESYTTVEALAKQLGVSKRSIRYDLEAINAWLEMNDLPKIVSTPRKGVLYELSEAFLEKLETNLLREHRAEPELDIDARQQIVLFNLLISTGVISLESLAKKIKVSKTTIANDINAIQEQIKPQGLTIERTRGVGIEINGDEANKRNSLVKLLRSLATKGTLQENMTTLEDAFQSIKAYFPKLDIDFIIKLIETLEKESGYHFTAEGIIDLITHIALTVERLRFDKKIIIDKDRLHELQKNPFYSSAKNLAEQIEAHFKIRIPQDEIGYITIHLMSTKLTGIDHMDVGSDSQHNLYSLILDVIKRISEYLRVQFLNEKELADDLYLHMSSTLERLKSRQTIINPIFDEIVQKYSSVFNASKKAIKILESAYDVHFTDHEISYVAMHIGAALELKSYKEQLKINVLLVCASGIGTSRLLRTKLISNFTNFNIVATVSYFEMEKFLCDHTIDLIISTLPLDSKHKKSVTVTPLLSEKDVEKLSSYLKVNRQSEKKLNEVEPLIEDMMKIIESHAQVHSSENLKRDLVQLLNKQKNRTAKSQLIDKDLIMTQVKCTDWVSAVKKASEPFIKQQYVTKSYVEKIIENSTTYGPYMVVAPGIAMPHAGTEDGVFKTGIGIMTLEKPIKFNHKSNDPVKVVIFLSAIDNTTHIGQLSSLLGFLSEEGELDRLCQKKSRDEVIEYLNHNEVFYEI